MTTDRLRPTYRLEDLWAAVDEERCIFHAGARDGRNALDLTEEDSDLCLKSLSKEVFVKSSADRMGRRGVFHDVYRTVWEGRPIYVKFFRLETSQPFIISSFKRDTDADL